MNNLRGVLYAVVSSATFGLIPLFSIPLLQGGMSSPAILFYRFGLAAAMMGLIALATRRPLRITWPQTGTLLLLGAMYSVTALGLLRSYTYIPSSVATTINFLYPLGVAIVMTLFFREKNSVWLLVAILISLVGVALLSWGDIGGPQSDRAIVGVGFAGATVLTYTIYIVGVKKSRISRLDPMIQAFCPAFQRLLLPRVRSVHDRCSAARQVASLAKPPVTGPGADRRIQPDARSSNQGDRFYDDIDPRFDGAADGSTRRGAAFRGEVRPRQCLGPDTDYHGGHHRHSSGQEKGTSANPPARKHPLASAVTAAEETFRQGATDYRSFFSGRLGNHPFSTRLRCSNNSPILQNEEAPQTANRVDQTMFSTSTEPMTAAIPIRRKIHQIRTPK